MADVTVGSITVYCTNLEKTRRFYETIGLILNKITYELPPFYRFQAKPEKSMWFWLEQVQSGDVLDNSVRLGFRVNGFNDVVAKLMSLQVTILPQADKSFYQFTNYVAVLDPDNRQVYLYKNN